MKQGIHIYNNDTVIPNIDWSGFDYRIFHYEPDDLYKAIPLKNYTRHGLQLSRATQKEALLYFDTLPKKTGENIKHLIVLNELIVKDTGKDLLPNWWDREKAAHHINKIREVNPGVKLWISNHKLLNPMFDRVAKRKMLIELALELGLDGVGLQVWLDWKMFGVPGYYLESILPTNILYKLFGDYSTKKIGIRDIDNNLNLIDYELKTKLINFFAQSLTSYILEFGNDVKANNLLFSVPEWAVFLTNQDRQYKVAKELLDTYKKIGTEFNCYWYLSDNLEKKQPGKEGSPGLLDKNFKPKKIASLFGI